MPKVAWQETAEKVVKACKERRNYASRKDIPLHELDNFIDEVARITSQRHPLLAGSGHRDSIAHYIATKSWPKIEISQSTSNSGFGLASYRKGLALVYSCASSWVNRGAASVFNIDATIPGGYEPRAQIERRWGYKAENYDKAAYMAIEHLLGNTTESARTFAVIFKKHLLEASRPDGAGVTYRGTRLSEASLGLLENAVATRAVLTYPQFMSVTSNIAVAHKFAEGTFSGNASGWSAIFTIHGKPYRPLFDQTRECEYLFPFGASFNVARVIRGRAGSADIELSAQSESMGPPYFPCE